MKHGGHTNFDSKFQDIPGFSKTFSTFPGYLAAKFQDFPGKNSRKQRKSSIFKKLYWTIIVKELEII